jgi:parvulin-like peptidyl-prolyl isomerase
LIQTNTRAVADTLVRKLQQGEDWTQLARDYSIHPSARSQNPILEAESAELDPALQSALSALKPGQTSNVIQTSAGFFILRKE